MNKNPERPKDVDDLISEILNPKKKKKPHYKEVEEEILHNIFD